MLDPQVCRISYRRSRFSASLPEDRLYTPSHAWLKEVEPGLWQVGYTQFAIRMLGDLVEHGWEAKPGQPIEPGDIVGWIEAFKATTDLYAVGTGTFHRSNANLNSDPALFDKWPYTEGWLYEFRGTPDATTVDARGYTALLDLAIDKIQGKTATEENPPS